MTLLALCLLACGRAEPPSPSPAAAAPVAVGGALDARTLVSLELPPSSRPEPGPVADDMHPVRDFELLRTVAGVSEYEAPHAFLPVAHLKDAPAGMALRLDGEPLDFEQGGTGSPTARTWGLTRQGVLLRLEAGAAVPSPEQVLIHHPAAAARENALNLDSSGLEPADFAFRTTLLGKTSRSGLLLPAPASATWRLTVPPAGVLDSEVGILPSEVHPKRRSDGAELVVEVDAGEGWVEAGRTPTEWNKWSPVRVELAAWAGQEVSLRLRTEPGANALLDYVFLAAPAVVSPAQPGRRVVMILVDTLRQDALGLYGSPRDTSPAVDAWAARAAVFDQARSISSWTLPSTRAVLSGRQPELWAEHVSLAEEFTAAGWLSGAFVANHLLTAGFDMTDGWARHDYWAQHPAPDRVDAALAWLDEHPDRDVFLLLHLMDPHLPYSEPEPFASKWAGPAPAELRGTINRGGYTSLVRRTEDPDRKRALQDYARARYDQNVAFTDHALGRFLAALPDDAVVALSSDHGEEFWEHDGFEHGHTMFDELLRVPLIVRAPSVPAGRHPEPVTLLDVAPTLRELAGLPARESDGDSLVGVTRGEAPLPPRKLGFGRAYYAPDLWGVVADGSKWISGDGEQRLFDLSVDLAEQSPVAHEAATWAGHTSEAVGLPMQAAIRLRAFGPGPEQRAVLTVAHPAGIERWWPAYDYRGELAPYSGRIELEGGALTVTQEAGEAPRPEIFLQLGGGSLDLAALELQVTLGELVMDGRGGPERRHVGRGKARWLADVAWTVEQPAQAPEGFSSDGVEELRALGYID